VSTGSLARQIEEASLNAWPALQQLLYDGWVLRFSEGYTKRANSVNSLCGPSAQATAGEAEARVRFAEECYRDRGLPTIFRITPFSVPRDLDAFLERRGYVRLDPTQVMVLDLGHFEPLSHVSSCSANPAGELRQKELDAWLTLFAHLHDEALESQRKHRAILRSIAAEVQPYVLGVRGRPVACALGVLEEERLGLFDLYVHPAFRRQGYGTAMTSRILAQAKQGGVRWAYLQVTEANEAAQGMYRKLGFGDLYRYWYRIQSD
jgi:GNAT superfamily N-acetyltransferase